MLADKKIVKLEVSKEHLKTLNEASTLLISCVDFRLIVIAKVKGTSKLHEKGTREFGVT